MDGISIYTHASKDWQNPGLNKGGQQRLVGESSKGEDVKNTSHAKESGEGKLSSVADKVTLSAEAQHKLHELSARDQQVRAHEEAHAIVGGRYAGAPKLTYEEGPDGRRYAIEGEVSIDVSEVPGDPEKTLEKADIIKRAALAPQNPSSADRAIAAKANQMAAEARREMAAEQNEGLQNGVESALSNSSSGQGGPFENNAESDSQQPDFIDRGQFLNIRT